MIDRLQMLLLVLVLLGVGALLGSFWLEWRGPRLAEAGDTIVGTPASPGEEPDERLRVEVLNGAGDPGAAREVAMRLREKGFDVVYFGNAGTFGHEVTHVVNRSGRTGAAGRIAEVLGADSVATEIDPELYLDGSVVLGRDWADLPGLR